MASNTASPPEDGGEGQSLDRATVEAQAFLGWVRAVGVETDNLTDGTALMQVLEGVDPNQFRNPHADVGGRDTYVLKLGTLKRFYKLMAQYYAESLSLDIKALPVPDLDELARSSSNVELCKLCRLAIGIAILSDTTKAEHIQAIQTLPEADQGRMMVAIDAVMGATKPLSSSSQYTAQQDAASSGDHVDADEYVDRESLAKAKQATREIEKAYLALADEHQSFKNAQDDLVAERRELQKEIARLQESAQREKASGADAILREDVEKLRVQLRKSEDDLAEAESEVERLSSSQKELNKKVADLQAQANEATRLKDQVDEYRHLADKSQRLENALEKYKKKLEETSAMRRQLKELEDQNSRLIDRNASLEKEFSRVADFKPLMESYRLQIDDLNALNTRLREESATQAYNLEQASLQIKALEEARSKDGEEMQLFQERVQELELGGARPRRRQRETGDGYAEGEDDEDDGVLIGSELDDALQGTTMTDLKLRIHAISRELKASKRNQADGSRIVILENLLEDAERQKKRYEADYWKEYKERLHLSGELERIRSGKSELGDGDEAAYALRLRLNEVVSELDELKRRHEEAAVKHETMQRELTIAKSDLALMGRDQTEILAELRASVGKEKIGLEEQVQLLKSKLTASHEEAQKLASQIQGLLMDKISLMEGGWGAKADDLRHEKEIGELRAFLAGKSLPAEAEEMILRLCAESKDSKTQLEALKERMKKAKAFIKQQDRMLKETQSKQQSGSTTHGAGDSGIQDVRRENLQLKREQELIMSAFHHLAHARLPSLARGGAEGMPGTAPPPARSWLGSQQRERMSINWALGRR